MPPGETRGMLRPEEATMSRVTHPLRGLVAVLLVASTLGACSPSTEGVSESSTEGASEPSNWSVPDPALRRCIEGALGVPTGRPLARTDMEALDELICPEGGVTSLSGLEAASNLLTLDLYSNEIVDVSPLAGLTNLGELYLGGNGIVDVSPLAGLTNLTHLNLGANGIVDVSLLAELTNLGWLNLTGNPVTDLSSLAGLDAEILVD